MKSVTVSEVLDWIRCRQLWAYRYGQGLKPIEKSTNMVSGWVVHKTIQDALAGRVPSMDAHVEALLYQEFDGDEELVQRYQPGVMRALSKVPSWVWDEENWHVEEGLGIALGEDEIRGRPDLFRVDDKTVDIIEFKTTEAESLEFLLWNPQHQYYGLMLSRLYPDRVIRFRYVCLPTSTKKYADTMPWIFTSRQMVAAQAELQLVVSEVGKLAIARSRGRGCEFCDYNKLCATVLTGGDEAGTTREYYKQGE